MPEVTVVTPNAPTWFDLASPDIEASKRFYSQLFGWEAQQQGGPEMGNYTNFLLNGKEVAGLVSTMNEGQHPAWSTYIASVDVDETAEKVRSAGGEIAMEPMDVMEAGRLCVFRDPTGAFLGLWQAGAHKGAAILREPNSFCWFELQTRDVAAARQFYPKVFGWGVEISPMGPGQPDYTQWMLDGEGIGGAREMQPNIPPQVPPHWLVYFRVENVDRFAELVKQLGGQVLAGPMEYPGGRFAVFADPQGANVGILE